MFTKLKLWNRKRKFVKAYMILRKEADQHKFAGHLMHFEAVGVERIHMACPGCPEQHPYTKRKDRYTRPLDGR